MKMNEDIKIFSIIQLLILESSILIVLFNFVIIESRG